MKDYYSILGVSKNASQDEIKTQYRKLAIKYHPDRSEDPKANEKMALINEAYTILKDPEKRMAYDQYGTSDDTSSYNPNYNQYEYNNGYVYNKSIFNIGKKIFVAILIFVALRFISLIVVNNYSDKDNYTLKYINDSSNSVYVRGINYSMFSDIKSVVIPETYVISNKICYEINGIYYRAFYYETNLKEITLSSNIKEIDDYAFYGCNNLKTVYFYGTIEEFNTIKIGNGNEYFKSAEIVILSK